jgi:hypothetical protein
MKVSPLPDLQTVISTFVDEKETVENNDRLWDFPIEVNQLTTDWIESQYSIAVGKRKFKLFFTVLFETEGVLLMSSRRRERRDHVNSFSIEPSRSK